MGFGDERADGGHRESHIPKVVDIPEVTCPHCNGGGTIAVGPWGRNPSKVRCGVCQGKGILSRDPAEIFRIGVELGRMSAHLERYDQFDTGSLAFGAVDSPYEPGVEIPRAEGYNRRGAGF